MSYLKRVMAIVMVGGGDSEGSGCAGDRLGESQWARDQNSERERLGEWNRADAKKRDGKHRMLGNVDGGNREIERRRRWQGGAESGESSSSSNGAAGCYHEKQASTLIF